MRHGDTKPPVPKLTDGRSYPPRRLAEALLAPRLVWGLCPSRLGAAGARAINDRHATRDVTQT